MRLLLVTGTGGAGRTTLAAAAAVRAAGHGAKTLFAALDGAPPAGDVLGVRLPADGSAVEAVPGVFTIAPGPDLTAEGAALQRHLGIACAGLGLDPPAAAELAQLPTLDDVLRLAALHEHVRSGRWDVVVVDLGAVPGALRALALPDTLRRLLGRVLPAERRIERLLRPPAGGHAPGADDGDPVVVAADAAVRALAAITSTLSDPDTGVLLVTTPGTVPLAATRRAHAALAVQGRTPSAVVVNRIPAPGGPGTAATAEVLASAAAAFAPVPVLQVRERTAEPVGERALAAIGAELDLPAERPVPAPDRPRPDVERVDDGYLLHLPVPHTRAADVDLALRGESLVIGLPGGGHVVDLPGGLRRCLPTGASLRGGRLSVRFVPDPALWPRA